MRTRLAVFVALIIALIALPQAALLIAQAQQQPTPINPTFPPTWTPVPTNTLPPTSEATVTPTRTPTKISPLILTATAFALTRMPRSATPTPEVVQPVNPTNSTNPTPLPTLAPISTLPPVPTVPSGTLPQGKLVFSESQDPATSFLVLVDTSTGDHRNLTNPQQGVTDVNPRWSPDGQRVIFQSNRGGKSELWVVSADGSSVQRLENGEYPAFSPDGAQIAFIYERDGFRNLYAMNSDATKARRLSRGQWNDTAPDWSPDGAQILFSSTRENSVGSLWVANASDGRNLRLVAKDLGTNLFGVWSPDGAKVVAKYLDAGNQPQINLIDVASGTITPLPEATADLTAVSRAIWSPDGQGLIFAGQVASGEWALFVFDLNTLQRTPVLGRQTGIDGLTWVQ